MNLGLGPAKRSTKRLLLDELPLAGGNISTRRLAQSPIKERMPCAFMAMSGMSESAKIDPYARLGLTPIVRNYLRIQRHPVCMGNILCKAAAIGSIHTPHTHTHIAYFTGSSLFFIDALCLKSHEYGVIFGASSLWVMASARGAGNSAAGGYRLRK